MQIKRRQHYIWRYYLEAWENNGILFCLGNNKIFSTNSVNLGLKKDIYRLVELNADDINLVNSLFISEQTEKLNRYWIPLFNKVFEIRDLLKNKELLSEKVIKTINILVNNLAEEFHTGIENLGKPIIDQLRNESFSFLDDEKAIADFLYFLSVQYFRTYHMKMLTRKAGENFNIKNLSKIWNVSLIILSTSMAYNFFTFRDTTNYTLLKTDSLPFLTGDQPIINTLADYKKPRILKDHEFEIYYPISPKFSLLVSFNCKKPKHEIKLINDIQVINYNIQIYRASYQQVYSNKKDLLEDLKKLT